MKNAVAILFTICVAVLFAACLTTPPAAQESPAPSPDPAAAVQPAETVNAETITPEPDIAETAAAPASPVEPALTETPVAEDSTPVPLPGERVITFYPEPDLFVPDFAADTAAVSSAQVKPPVPAAPAVPAAQAAPAKTPAKAEIEKTEKSDTPVKAAAETEKAAEDTNETVEKGIWTTEPIAPAVLPAQKAAPQAASRSASLSVGQNLQVWYPGSGWVYLGDASTLNGMAYESRKLDRSDTLFLFKAIKEGSYTLEFSRYDVLSDSFSEDALSVTVLSGTGSRAGIVRAPDYRSLEAAANIAPAQPSTGTAAAAASAVPSKPAASGSPVTDEPGVLAAVTQAASAKPTMETEDGSALLEAARAAIAKGDPGSALTALDAFFSKAVMNLDEGWFLRGQAFEANGATKNIKKALDSYQTLVSAFPDSGRWKEADARIRYIKRFYLDIR